MLIRVAAVLAALAAAALSPSAALAQYKNTTMGFDAAYGVNVRPPIVDENGDLLGEGHRPLRLFMGGRVGAEYNYKMSADHWWLDMRLAMGLWTFGPIVAGGVTREYDLAAMRQVGTILSTLGSIGIRYVILTDRIRPYVQLSVSYMHLFSFMQDNDSPCPDEVCGDLNSETEYSALFPHENVVGVHLQPGLEWVVAQDFALHFYVDTAGWFTINSLPVLNLSPGVGVLFFM